MAVSAFIAALLGSGHCAAMCGAFACAAADVAPGQLARLRASLAYHAGRLASYVALGAAAGAVGAQLDAAAAFRETVRPAAVVAGIVLILWGAGQLLAMAGVRLPRVPASRVAARLMAVGLRGVAERSPRLRATALGLLAPLLPCGWLYAFVASAGATGAPLSGAAVMAGFWLGTVPALAVVSLGLHGALGRARRLVPLVTALALIVVGSLTVARGIRGGTTLHHAHAAMPVAP
jgi:hypothetical protein